jgi:glycosyltransferase involved in cell wall biosynthesis
VFHFLGVCIRSISALMRLRPDVVHYPPSNGAEGLPFIRDVLLLSLLRTLFRHVKYVFSFNAAGLSEHLARRPDLLRGIRGGLVRRAFFDADGAVRLSRFNPEDGEFLRAARCVIIPNGLRDEWNGVRAARQGPATLIYMGVLRRDKGINDLLEAAALLKARGLDFRLICAGEFVSPAYRMEVEQLLRDHKLRDDVTFPGILRDEDKFRVLNDTDIFVYPTFADFESFGRVVVEAMMFELPVVASRWRGVQEVVQDGITGILVEPRNPGALADALARLLKDSMLRDSMGKAGRARYLREYTEDVMFRRYETFYTETAGQKN